ncbi:MAG: YfhO family protein [Lachnospiraceae bacterium]|nr:YfhO family protein [Lachnospiraceae bacterium]
MKVFLSKKLYPLYSAIFATVIFITGLSLIGVIGFNNKIILYGDLDAQYVPFIKMFLRAITGQEDYWYSFSNYLGSGTALTYAYYCINPFNLLFLFDTVPESVICIVLISAKIALAACTFQIFESKALKLDSPLTIAFSVCYTLGGYSAAMYTNIMWLDAIYTLPILTFLTMKAANGISKSENKSDTNYEFPFISLTLTFAYLFITNFYLAFMVGIFEAIVFVLSFLRYPKENALRQFVQRGIKYAASVVLAAALCAAALIPAAYFLYTHMAQDNQDFKELFATVPDIINSFFIGSFPGLDNSTPFLYSSLPVLLLTPFFFFVKSISRREKILAAVCLAYYLLCMLVLPLYEFMHVFDFPNWYAYRFSFCISFVLCSMAAITILHSREINKKAYIIYTFSLIALYSVMIPICALRYKSYQLGNTNNTMFVNIVFLLVYLLLLLLYKRASSKRALYTLAAFFVAVVGIEILANFYITSINRGDLVNEIAEEQWLTEGNAVQKIKANDSGVYRISVINQTNSNAPSWFGYMGLNTFSSSDDYNLRHALYNLGVYATNRAILEAGYTPITYALTGTKYRIIEYSEREELENSPETVSLNIITQPRIEDLDTYLPVIFMANNDIENYEAGTDPFINQENLMSCLTGSEHHFFKPINPDELFIGKYNAEIQENSQVTLFTKKSPMSDTLYYSFVRPHNDDETFYACFYQPEGEAVRNTMYVICAPEGWWETAELKRGGIVSGGTLSEVNFGYFDGINTDTVYDEIAIYTTNPEVKTGSCQAMHFYSYPKENSLKEICDDLTATAPTITSFRSSDIKATVHVTDDRPILFTTIPYDEGWSIYCDSKEVETIATVENAFLGAELPEGDHEIELKYTARFAKEGLIISLLGTAILSVIIIISLLQKREHADSQKDIAP